MRLLQSNGDGNLSVTEFFKDDIPEYAILSHRWEAEEVTFRDLIDGKSKVKAGYGKIQFCGEQARRDGLEYFWVDTCCIDKSSSAELSEAICSMFYWYQKAAKCYVFLSDVSRPQTDSADGCNEAWLSTFRQSEWFTRGWTLPELIAPASVDFFCKDRELLGNKVSLERQICEVTGIPASALRGSPLSDFSVAERLSWAAGRETTREEDKAYSLLGIFDVSMAPIYGEGQDKALTRLQKEIDSALRGFKREDFSVSFSLSDFDIEHFVARKTELVDIHKALGGDGSRRVVVLHGLGGIGKTQLSIAYAKRHKNNYSAIFWLDTNNEHSLKQSFTKVAKQISREHPSAIPVSNRETDQNLDEVVKSVKAWLSLPGNTRWLIIFDNYDPKLPGKTDPTAVDIRKFLPESYQGSIIITTRSSEVKIGHSIQIRNFVDVRDSLKILSTMSRREGLVTDPDAVKLAERLDGFPLALAQAGAYLNQTAGSVLDHLRLYEETWARLKETSPELSSDKYRTVYSTWQISFDHVKKQNDLAGQSLQIAPTNDSDSDYSVASLESFNGSMASSATSISDTAPIVLDSATEMVNLLIKDQQLRDLLDESFQLLQSEKVTRNFRRALHFFSKELLLEAQTPPQEQAAKFVRQRSRQVSVLLRERIHPSDALQLSGHNGDTLREERLRDFLGGLQPGCTQDSLQPEAEEDSEQDDYGDPDDRPDLSTLREWLLASNAMQNLKDRFRLFLFPEKGSPKSKATADSPEKTDLSEYLKKPSGPRCVRLEWTCICGHSSHDNFQEFRPGAVATYAEQLRRSGYVTHAQPTTTKPGISRALLTAVGNKVAAVGRSISTTKPNSNGGKLKPKARRFATIQCSPTPDVTCRWLHLCIKRRPNAKVTKLEPVHICKDREENELRDAGLFQLLHKTWKTQRTWTDLILFKLKRIEFIKFTAFPDDSIDRMVADTMPPNTLHYDFAPPPPLEIIPPIAADHLVHLLTAECTASLQSGSFYLDQLPKKRDKPLKFISKDPHNEDINIGYGLRFVETPDPSVIVTFLFGVVVVIGTVFGVCWSVVERDLQSAWTIAAYLVSLGALAVVTWQVRMTS